MDVISPRHNVLNLQVGKGQWIGVNADRNSLPTLFNKLGHTIGVEVGTQRGNYAIRICAENPALNLICVDPWSSFGGPGLTRQNNNMAVASAKLSKFNCTMIRKESKKSVSDFKDDSIDFVYIDGNHTFDYVALDIILWSRKVRHGGIVACHDYCNWWEVGVMQAVDAYTFCHGISPKYVTAEQSPTAFWVNP